MDETIRELLDLRAIEQLMVRYADRIDANDPEGAAACFAQDGIGNYWGKFQGRNEITARLSKILDRFSATSHHLTNVNIRLDGNRATAMSTPRGAAPGSARQRATSRSRMPRAWSVSASPRAWSRSTSACSTTGWRPATMRNLLPW